MATPETPSPWRPEHVEIEFPDGSSGAYRCDPVVARALVERTAVLIAAEQHHDVTTVDTLPPATVDRAAYALKLVQQSARAVDGDSPSL